MAKMVASEAPEHFIDVSWDCITVTLFILLSHLGGD